MKVSQLLPSDRTSSPLSEKLMKLCIQESSTRFLFFDSNSSFIGACGRSSISPPIFIGLHISYFGLGALAGPKESGLPKLEINLFSCLLLESLLSFSSKFGPRVHVNVMIKF